ncbi:MAG: PD-(D/E)XK nuclease family protein [Candidatus Cryptobacteroides sp.]
MRPFLKQLAEHYYAQGGSESLCFVFPNRRSLLFFRKYYAEELKRDRKTLLAPSMLSINDFFYKVSGHSVSEHTDLLLILYKCYRNLRGGKCDSLDEFIFWGEMILSDFNEVDKYLVDAEDLFSVISDFNKIGDLSYLSEKQKEALKVFVGHIFDEDLENKKYKLSFVKTWELLLPLYRDYKAELKAQGKAYEGMVYKELAENMDADLLKKAFPDCSKFVFIGLNQPSRSERKVLKTIKKSGLGEFCWDYSSQMIKDRANRSSLFMEQNIAELGNDFIPDPEGLCLPEINVLSVPSTIGQCKQLPAIFKSLDCETIGLNTAVVLPDESLLIPCLNSIPPEIKEVNVTMGYPISGSIIFSLLDEIFDMQLHLRVNQKTSEYLFYHKQSFDILSNPLLGSILTEEEKDLAKNLKLSLKHYLGEKDFPKGGILRLIFQPVVKDTQSADKNQIKQICEYLKDIIVDLSHRLLSQGKESVELDFARDIYLAIESLEKYELELLPANFYKLLGRLLRRASVPFKGEPLQGLQIMGPLETRALDFENVIILSCNEGVFPRRNVGESFIPPELRRIFELPTYENQDALWAYYFYRLIQRAEKIWMVFSSNTQQKIKSSEESRFIKQLEMHFQLKVNRFVAKSPISELQDERAIKKTKDHLIILREKNLSASALQNYLSCPAKLYYSKVEDLSKVQEVSEYLDKGMIGDVVHSVMHDLYDREDKLISRSYIKQLLKSKSFEALIDGKVLENLKSPEIKGRNLLYKNLISRYISQILRTDLRLLETKGKEEFKILGLEQFVEKKIKGFRFVGFIDRIDSFEDECIRVVDYKTGAVKDEDIDINSDNAKTVAEEVFGDDDSKRPKIALQLYLYDSFIMDKYPKKNVVNVIYQTTKLFSDSLLEKEICSDFLDYMDSGLENCLEEIKDIKQPWTKTDNVRICEWCDFKNICGR